MKKLLLLSFLLTLFCLQAQAQEDHPIDKRLGECLDKDYTTAGMHGCLNVAYEEWDKELNKVYGELRAVMNESQKESLKTAQLAWIKQRDAEFKLISQTIGSRQGTMYGIMAGDQRVDIIRKRAKALQYYLDFLTEEY